MNLAHHSARQKLLLFLHEIFLRLLQTEPGRKASFRLPLTQQQLGDLLGMTSLHVSRTLCTLNDANLVHRDRFGITFPDLAGLREECGFPDSFLYDNHVPLLEDPLGQKSFVQ